MAFSFYTVRPEYCDFLRQKDPCVPYTMDAKSIRPFIGILFTVNGFHYYAPLTSPKPKHIHMKNQVDFMKIRNGELGAINNFNNMIPVPISCLSRVEIRRKEGDCAQDIAYIRISFPIRCPGAILTEMRSSGRPENRMKSLSKGRHGSSLLNGVAILHWMNRDAWNTAEILQKINHSKRYGTVGLSLYGNGSGKCQ